MKQKIKVEERRYDFDFLYVLMDGKGRPYSGSAVVGVMFMLVGCVGVERPQSTVRPPDRGQDRTHITSVSSL